MPGDLWAYLGAIFDLGLSAYPTRYTRGEVFGVLSMSLTQQEMIAKVEAAMERRCGAVPDLANPDDGIPILEWLTWCVEVMKSGDPQHLPEGDVAAGSPSRGPCSVMVAICGTVQPDNSRRVTAVPRGSWKCRPRL